MDKNTSQVTEVTPAQAHLFDVGQRIYKGFADRDESLFSFLNRSAKESVEIARKTLENWFYELPEDKKEDIRSRFRGDDRQHQGALLELATHQILNAMCTGVQVDPSFDNLTPDFAATYKGTKLVVECTVAQESDQDFNATQREARIKQAIVSLVPKTGPQAKVYNRARHQACGGTERWSRNDGGTRRSSSFGLRWKRLKAARR